MCIHGEIKLFSGSTIVFVVGLQAGLKGQLVVMCVQLVASDVCTASSDVCTASSDVCTAGSGVYS